MRGLFAYAADRAELFALLCPLLCRSPSLLLVEGDVECVLLPLRRMVGGWNEAVDLFIQQETSLSQMDGAPFLQVLPLAGAQV